MAIILLIFWRTSIMFSVFLPIYNFINSIKDSLFSISLPKIVSLLLILCHCNSCRMMCHFGFNLHFLMPRALNTFSYIPVGFWHIFCGKKNVHLGHLFILNLDLNFKILLLNCMSQCISWILLIMCKFACIFYHYIGCFSILLSTWLYKNTSLKFQLFTSAFVAQASLVKMGKSVWRQHYKLSHFSFQITMVSELILSL